MNALLYRDLVVLKKLLLIVGLLFVVVGGYGLYNHEPLVVSGLLMFLPVALTGSSFAFDEQSMSNRFVLCAPIGRRTLVTSKYLPMWTFAILNLVLTAVVFTFATQVSWRNALLIATLAMAVTIVFVGSQLPFLFKYGAEKGRLVMAAFSMMIFVGSNLLGSYEDELIGWAQRIIGLPTLAQFGIVVIFAVVVCLISYRSSLAIMRGKDL